MSTASAPKPFVAGFLLFPRITQLDMTGPFEVITRIPGAQVHLLWKTKDPVTSDSGMTIMPTTTFDECPKLDLVCVPGGPGMNPLLNDAETLDFLRRVAPDAQWITSVCTGSLVLGAAGLLKGKRAASHWMSRDMLSAFGATPVAERVVRDGKIVTGGGVTAGIDFGLEIAAAVCGEDGARKIQLSIEYDPQPPFDSGSPRVASPELVAAATKAAEPRQKEREELVARAAAAL